MSSSFALRDLGAQDRHRVLDHRLGQREHLERVVGRLGVERGDRLDQVERQRLVEREVALEVGIDAGAVRPGSTCTMPALRSERKQRGRVAPQAALARRALVAALDQLAEHAVAARARSARARAGAATGSCRASTPKLRHQRLGRLRHRAARSSRASSPRSGAAAPFRGWPLARRALPSPPRPCSRVTCSGAWHTTLPRSSKPLPPGAPGDLLEVARREQAHAARRRTCSRPREAARVRIGMFTPTPSVSVPADHAQQALLRELLDQQPVLRQQARVVDADAVAEHALHVLAVRRVEAARPAAPRRCARAARASRPSRWSAPAPARPPRAA